MHDWSTFIFKVLAADLVLYMYMIIYDNDVV